MSDDVLLDAATRALSAYGPDGFTLARVAAEADVSAAAIVKRFGSKDAMYLRLCERWAASVGPMLTRAAAPHPGPLARFRAVALHNYHDLDRPESAARQLAALGVDLQDAALCALLDTGWREVRRHLAQHARAASVAGDLVGAPAPAQLARIVAGAMEGGALMWSVRPTGSLITRLRGDLDALLAPWVPTRTEQP